MSSLIKCPECNEVLFVVNEKGYMIGNVILGDYFEGQCGCGFQFEVIDGIFMVDYEL